ncbi:MAG TPA: matrixin family metalloprotease [Gemmatimonadales bacterium]
MFRNVLIVLTVLLGCLVLADGVRRVTTARRPVQSAAPSGKAALAGAGNPSIPDSVPLAAVTATTEAPDTATPALDMMFRLAVRRRLAREGNRVYLDSLYPHTDSLLARWNNHPVVSVALVADTTLPGWSPELFQDVRTAMRGWDGNASGITFQESTSPDSADVSVRWVDLLPIRGQVGTTTLVWGADGVAHHATVVLALRRNGDSSLVPGAQRARVALHELGHVLGLPHSGSTDDVMFPAALSDVPSDRDQATLRLLYAVPPGPLRVQP